MIDSKYSIQFCPELSASTTPLTKMVDGKRTRNTKGGMKIEKQKLNCYSTLTMFKPFSYVHTLLSTLRCFVTLPPPPVALPMHYSDYSVIHLNDSQGNIILLLPNHYMFPCPETFQCHTFCCLL